MLKSGPKNIGTRGQFIGPSKMVAPIDNTPTYAELGIDYKTSSLAKQVAELSDEQIEKVKRGVALATAIKIEALRQLGNMLKETERQKPGEYWTKKRY